MPVDVEITIMALRGEARHALSMGADEGAAIFALCRDASRAGLTQAQINGVVAQLRDEGLIRRVDRASD